MEDLDIVLVFLGFLVGLFVGAAMLSSFGMPDIGLSQESADLVCQKITNNSNAISIDWEIGKNEPKDSLICDVQIDNRLIQIISS